MGMFSSKKKVSVSSSIINMGGTAVRKNFLTQVINGSIVYGKGDIAEDIVRATLNGAGMKLKQMYKYGKNHYTRGLPVGSFAQNFPSEDYFTNFLETKIEKKDLTVYHNYTGIINSDFVINEYLYHLYGYNVDIDYWDNPPIGMPTESDFDYEIVSITKTELNFKLLFTKTTGNPSTEEEDEKNTTVLLEIPLTISEYDKYEPYKDHLCAIYRTVENLIIENSTTTARITVSTDVPTSNTVTNRNVSSNGVITETRETTAIKLEIYDPDTMSDYKFTDNTIPIKGTEITSTHITKLNFNYSELKFFSYLIGSGKYPELDSTYENKKHTSDSDYFPIVIFREYGADMFDGYHQAYDRNYTSSVNLLSKIDMNLQTIVTGLNRNPDVYQVNHAYMIVGVSLNTNEQVGLEYLFNHFTYMHSSVMSGTLNGYNNRVVCGSYNIMYYFSGINIKDTTGVIGTVGTYMKSRGGFNVIYLTKQISSKVYRTITISGLTYGNIIYGNKGVVTYAWHSIYDSEETFIVPMLYSVAAKMSLTHLTQLCSDAYHMVFNSYKITKVKWYESLLNSVFFKIVLVAIAVVITIFSAGTLSGLSAAMTAAATAGTSVTAAALSYLASTLAGTIIYGTLVSYGISYGIQLLGSITGSELLLTIATIAAVAMSVASFSGIANSMLSFKDILNAIPAITKGISTVQSNEIMDVYKDYTKSNAILSAKQDELTNKIYELTGNPDTFNYVTVYEKPDDFLTRTLITNPTRVFISQIENYVDNMLTLPENLSDIFKQTDVVDSEA